MVPINLPLVGGGQFYSTTEQVIGTWIDGKPIYQVVDINNSFDNSIVDALLEEKSITMASPILSPIKSVLPVVSGSTSSITASTEWNSTYASWKAFDGSTGTRWAGNTNDSASWLQYLTNSIFTIDNISLNNQSVDADIDTISTLTLYGYNSNSNTWDTLLTLNVNSKAYNYTNVSIDETKKSLLYKGIKLQFGRNDLRKVAGMTEVTLYGKVSEITQVKLYTYTKLTD